MAKKLVSLVKVDPEEGLTYEAYVGICVALGKEPETREEFEKGKKEGEAKARNAKKKS